MRSCTPKLCKGSMKILPGAANHFIDSIMLPFVSCVQCSYYLQDSDDNGQKSLSKYFQFLCDWIKFRVCVFTFFKSFHLSWDKCLWQ